MKGALAFSPITHLFFNTPVRKLRENARVLLAPPKLTSYLNIFRDNLWPGGIAKLSGVPRTTEEKLKTRDEANRKLSSLVPGMVYIFSALIYLTLD